MLIFYLEMIVSTKILLLLSILSTFTSTTLIQVELLNEDVNIVSPYRPPIFVEGIEVNSSAIQLDGYSTYVYHQQTFPKFQDDITFSVWFATPSYPSESAAIFAMDAFQVVLDKYGILALIFSMKNGLKVEIELDDVFVPLDQWVFLQVHISSDHTLTVILNQQEVITELNSSQILWPNPNNTTEYYIGRHSLEDKPQAFFDLHTFFGVISNVKLTIGQHKYYMQSDFTVENELQDWEFYSEPDFEIDYYEDIHRPRLHAMPQRGWANEPHGFIFHRGRYHLFFQKNGNGPFWHNIKWGHISSPDLVHWTEHPIILWPEEGADQVGVWSGHLIIPEDGKKEEGIPTIFYTGADGVKAGIFAATGSQDMMIWKKFGKTEDGAQPVIPSRPQGDYPGDDFRDPFIFQYNNTWYMIVGTGIDTNLGRMGSVFLYSSNNLYSNSWTFKGTLFTGNTASMNYNVGQFWEMPVFVQLDEDDWLFVVTKTPGAGDVARTLYWTGTFDGNTFRSYSLTPKVLELFVNMLSPAVAYDAQGNLTAIGISPDTWDAFKDDGMYHAEVGWANVFTFPRRWEVSKLGEIQQTPHPALQLLRKQKILSLQTQQSEFICEGIRMLEIVAFFNCSLCKRAGFVLFKSDNEQTSIYYDFVLKKLVVDRRQSSTDPNAITNIYEDQYCHDQKQIFKFHLYIDHSIIEVFINDKDTFVTRVFPEQLNSTTMEVLLDLGKPTLLDQAIVQLDAWQLDL